MMHGLVNRSIQCFVRDTFGAAAWARIAAAAGCPPDGFEAMLRYDSGTTDQLIAAAADQLDRTAESLLEDLGTYLVSHPNRESLRRLLRFGGVDFVEFLHSLDDLPGRARLAVPDLDLPQIEVTEDSPGRYTIALRCDRAGFATVLAGVLRAMADDYGALVLLDHVGRRGDAEILEIELLDQSFAAGRRFELAATAAR
jgi:hypothetical protein